MQIDKKTLDGITVLQIQEPRIDAVRAPVLKQMLLTACEAGETRIAIDLNFVEFMDSSGLGALVSVLKSIGARGDLVLFGVKGLVGDLFKMTRMNRVFVIADDELSAIKKLNP
jgi:anti-sigma B factor antagonist